MTYQLSPESLNTLRLELIEQLEWLHSEEYRLRMYRLTMDRKHNFKIEDLEEDRQIDVAYLKAELTKINEQLKGL